MQDPLSLLQLTAEPKAIILKRQDLSLIFDLHYIFLYQRLQHKQRWTTHYRGQPSFCLFCPNYCESAHTYSPQG